MRILLVGNFSLDGSTSMPRYAEMLRSLLTSVGNQVEVISPMPFFGRWSKKPQIAKWLGYLDKFLLFPLTLRRRAKQFDLVHICDHSNAMYLQHCNGVPTSITCHDLLAVASAHGWYPTQTVSFTGKLLQRWILSSLAKARFVVSVSSATAQVLDQLAPNPSRTHRVIFNPLNYSFAPAPPTEVARIRSILGLQSQEAYLFHIGGNNWYKNRLGVLRIYAALCALLRDQAIRPPHLVMSGQPFTQAMRELTQTIQPAENQVPLVHEWVNPTDHEIAVLYTGAEALLFPSLYEGFGWPLIEAQSCGCPIITSNRPPMNEVAGAAALYIDPEDPIAAAAQIASKLTSLSEQRQPGFLNVARFSSEVLLPQYESFFQAVFTDSKSGSAGLVS